MNALKANYGYILLAFAVLGSWLLLSFQDVGEEGNRPLPPHSPDLFSTGYRKWEMDATGVASSQLTAAKVIHYSDDRTTDLTQPLFYMYRDRQPPWVIQAVSGKVSGDNKTIWLQGKALITRAAFDKEQALAIDTSNLKVTPDTNYAETVDFASLQSPPNVTTGTGMKLVFKRPIRIELLAHVQGTYETQPQTTTRTTQP